MIEMIFLNLICLAPFCMGMLGIGAAAFVLIRTAARQSRPLSAEQLKAEADALETRARLISLRLRPWAPGALADLSTDWDATWSRLGRDLKAHGAILGVGNRGETSWVAFALFARGAMDPESILHARTSGQVFDYRLSRAGVEIRVDGAPLGLARADGVLLGAGSAVIGEAKRPGGLPAVFQVGSIAVQRDARERSYPLVLGGTTVAYLANPPIQTLNVIGLTKQARLPALEIVDLRPARAADWALALAILQVAGYNVLESVWTNGGGLRLKRVGSYKAVRFS